MADLESGLEEQPPIWPIFGDLMSGLMGIFVLLLVWTLGFQVELAQTLKAEVAKREQEESRRELLEQALAAPLASGRVTLDNGRIGISGSVLFATNSAALQAEGRSLLQGLVTPLNFYLSEHQEVLMVSGFTDDMPVKSGNARFEDNWELSAQRSLTVTRTLIEFGLPETRVFAAAFGAQQPIVPNIDRDSRAQNRRVEIAPVPRVGSTVNDR